MMNAQAEEIRREVLAAYVGTEDDVLLETPLSGTLFTGYTRLYIPVVVSAPGHKSARSCMCAWVNTTANGSVQRSADFQPSFLVLLYKSTKAQIFNKFCAFSLFLPLPLW